MAKTVTTVSIHIGQRIRARRHALAISQNTIAAAAGVTFQQIQKYENGSNRVSGDVLVKLARALRVDVGYFFEGAPGLADSTTEVSALDALLASPEGAAVARAFVSIGNAKIRRQLAGAIEAFAAAATPASAQLLQAAE